jgi:hypothetical protein
LRLRMSFTTLLYERCDIADLTAALSRPFDDGPCIRMAAETRPVPECGDDFLTMSGAFAESFREDSLTRDRPLAAGVR